MRRQDWLPATAPVDTPPAAEVREALRAAPRTAAAAAVVAAFAAGGARFASVRAMRAGDITLLTGGGVRIAVVAEKLAAGRRRVFEVHGWEARRLTPFAEEGQATTPWRERRKIFDGVTAADMAAIYPARALRRAVAEEMLKAGGEQVAAGVLGNKPATLLTHYVGGQGLDAAMWGRVREGLSR